MKILVLGGNGYIGSRLYSHLKSKKYDVDNVDLCWYSKIFKETIQNNFDDLPISFFNINEIIDVIDSVYISNKRELDQVLNFKNI